MIIFLYFAVSCNLITQAAEVSEVEQLALANRKAIRSGQVDILAIVTNRDGDPVRKNEYWIEFENDKLRFDEFVSQKLDDASGLSGFKMQNIRTAEGHLFHRDAEHAGINTAVTKVSPEDMKEADSGSSLFDPRLLGFVTARCVNLYAFNFESFVGNPQRVDVSVVPEEFDGRNVLRVEYSRSDGAKSSIWIDPDRGHCVVRGETTSTFESDVFLERFDCELKQYGSDGIWFPETIRFEQFFNGVLSQGEIATVRAAKFNFDVNDDRFTLATMNIPPGTPIADSAQNPNGTQMWNGTKLVRMENPDLLASSLKDPPSQNTTSFWVVLLSSNLLFIVGLFLYWRYRKNLTT